MQDTNSHNKKYNYYESGNTHKEYHSVNHSVKRAANHRRNRKLPLHLKAKYYAILLAAGLSLVTLPIAHQRINATNEISQEEELDDNKVLTAYDVELNNLLENTNNLSDSYKENKMKNTDNYGKQIQDLYQEYHNLSRALLTTKIANAYNEECPDNMVDSEHIAFLAPNNDFPFPRVVTFSNVDSHGKVMVDKVLSQEDLPKDLMTNINDYIYSLSIEDSFNNNSSNKLSNQKSNIKNLLKSVNDLEKLNNSDIKYKYDTKKYSFVIDKNKDKDNTNDDIER